MLKCDEKRLNCAMNFIYYRGHCKFMEKQKRVSPSRKPCYEQETLEVSFEQC